MSELKCKRKVRSAGNDKAAELAHSFVMKEPSITYLEAWRKHRGLTGTELGNMVHRSKAFISELENGKKGYTQATLEALADALDCSPADLLGRPPETEDVVSILGKIPASQRNHALRVLSTFAEDEKKVR